MAALIVTAFAVHWWTARSRAADLLEHDEAISLLDAAGKSQRIDALYDGMTDLQILPAALGEDLGDWAAFAVAPAVTHGLPLLGA